MSAKFVKKSLKLICHLDHTGPIVVQYQNKLTLIA